MIEVLQGDCLDVLPTLPEKHFHCCVTSPPYFGLRSYLPDTVRLKKSLSDEQRAAIIAELTTLGVLPLDHASE